VPVRCVIIPEHGEVAEHFHAGRVERQRRVKASVMWVAALERLMLLLMVPFCLWLGPEHPGALLAAFFACWTRKEAFVKATGAGIFRQSLQSFVVSVDPGPGPVPLLIPGHDTEAGRWRLESIAAPPGYAAAVAVEGPFRVLRFHWNG